MSKTKAIVFGGNRYFGKRLVERLLEANWDVTIANRGLAPDPFGKRVKRFSLDREDDAALLKAASTGHWDFVFDQICYSPSDALGACNAFAGRVGRYIHTSTQSIYANDGCLRENDFDPATYPIRMGRRGDFDYGEAKRQAEAVYAQKADFPVTMMRIPIVLGPDDYTGRLEFHLDRVKQGKPIVVENISSEINFISSAEAADFVFWVAKRGHDGPINARSRGTITGKEFLALMENATGKKAVVLSSGSKEDISPIIDDVSRYMDISRAESLGFPFSDTKDWLVPLIAQKS